MRGQRGIFVRRMRRANFAKGILGDEVLFSLCFRGNYRQMEGWEFYYPLS